MTEFTLNGTPVTVRSDHPHLLAALREELDVTSPKDGCSPSGQCGCCTVMVDGKAVVSCNLGAGEGRRQGRRHARGRRRRRAAALRRRLRRLRRAAVRLLHPGHRDAGQVADRQEGRRPRPHGDGPAPRRPPVPLHRLRQDPRRHRGRRQGQVVPAGAGRVDRRVRRQVRGGRAGARRPRLRRRHPRARACCTPRCTSPTTPAPTSRRSTRRPRRPPTASSPCSPPPTSPASCASGSSTRTGRS